MNSKSCGLILSRTVVLKWGNPVPGVTSPYVLYNMESLINKFTNEHICFFTTYSKSRGLGTNDNYLREAW